MSDQPDIHDPAVRYARHLVLPEIGGQGQQKLAAASVAIVGMGGLGNPAAQYLAAAGCAWSLMSAASSIVLTFFTSLSVSWGRRGRHLTTTLTVVSAILSRRLR